MSGRVRVIVWVLVLAVLAGAVFWSGPAPLKSSSGINALEKVQLGGTDQWISIRGKDASNPVLLFLHGGPGSANLAKLRVQVPELEEQFVVVSWDQRGAGKSFASGDLSIDRMVVDAHELVTYLKGRFGVEKVTLVGFSWGTVVGLQLADQYPQDVQAYVSIGQVVKPMEGERLSLEFARQVAAQRGDERALRDLAVIDPTYAGDGWYDELMTERKWLLRFGGVYHTSDSYNHEALMLLHAPEYSLYEFARWPGASSHSLRVLWPEVMQIDFFKSVPRLDVPVVFLTGRYDYNDPSVLVEQYYQQLIAPAGKRLVWFEASAHDLFFDQPDRVVSEILSAGQGER
jgi:pimeloyl-ACP methyl ester carboxylesterase